MNTIRRLEDFASYEDMTCLMGSNQEVETFETATNHLLVFFLASEHFAEQGQACHADYLLGLHLFLQ